MPTSDSREQTPTSSPTERKFLARMTKYAVEITNLTVEFGEGDKKLKTVEDLNLSFCQERVSDWWESLVLENQQFFVQSVVWLSQKVELSGLMEKHSLTPEILQSIKVCRWSFKSLMDHSIQNTMLIAHSLSL